MNDLTVADNEMELEQNHAAVKQHWRAFAAGDLEGEHRIYHGDSTLEYPQSGELIVGRDNIKASRAAEPDRGRITASRILGQGDLWISDFILSNGSAQTNVVSIMEFRDGLVFHESRYFAQPFAPPPWRAPWTRVAPRP